MIRLKNARPKYQKAKAIIAESMQEFIEWYHMRRHVPMLKDLKTKLKSLHSYSLLNDAGSALGEETLDIKIQRVVNETAGKIKKTDTKGCQYIAAINEFIWTA
jgi:glutamyl-tRNA reductase